jgi:TetR/AcrR family transcriptional regulator
VPDRPDRPDQLATANGRRTGRPRRDGTVVTEDPTEAILAAAGRLFGSLGVGSTTMARLAAEVGLGQSSLYYYFRSREEVVAALVARANVVPLALIDAITADAGSVPSKLYRFVVGDVEALCALSFDINEIHRIAARERERFADYWRERRQLERRLGALVRTGVDAGELREVDPHVTALTIMANDEGTQNWYRLRPQRPRSVALALADITVGGLLPAAWPLADVVAEVATRNRR